MCIYERRRGSEKGASRRTGRGVEDRDAGVQAREGKTSGWVGGREETRASCRHLGLAFNLRASRRALIRAGSSSSYEPGLRYKHELEWVA